MSLSPQSLANLRNGRPPAFTEAQALTILRERINAGAGTTVPQFIKFESEPGGCLPRKISIGTLHALLKGRTFPNLIDPETGQKYDYTKVPSAPVGQPSRFNEDGVDPVTKERRRGIPPLRQWLLDRVLEDSGRQVNAKVLSQFTIIAHELTKDNAARDARIKHLEEELEELRGNPLLVGGRLG